MRDLGFLEKLLDGAEVEWKSLGEIAEYSRERISAEELDPCTYVGVDNLLQNRAGRIDSSYVPTSGNLTRFEEGDILIGNIRPYLRKIWLSDRTGGTNGDVLVIHPTDVVLSSRYLFQVLTDERFFEYNVQHSKGAKMPRGSKPQILQFLVPIPCPEEPGKSLAIQREIVRILDSFTELTAELTAELELRKKQYNHYRDQLLTFEEGKVEWRDLGELARIKTGQSVNKNMIADSPGEYPVINSGRDPLGYLDDWNTENDPIGITSRGAGVGSVTWQEGRYFRGNLNYSVTINAEEELDVHFLYHVLEQFQPQIKALCTFDGIPALNAVNLKKLNIPVPTIEEQARIAKTLDTFDTLTSSLSEGLPREIELRQKQYEYYRDLLLSFPTPAEAVEA